MSKDTTKETNFIFAKLCAKFQKECKKDSVNPHKSSKYVSIQSLLEYIEKNIMNEGFYFTQTISVVEGKNHLTTKVLSKDDNGFLRVSTIKMHDPESDKQFNNLNQNLGTALTYYRRYSLLLIFNIMPDEDTDGEGSSKTKTQSSSFKPDKIKQDNIPF